MSSAKPSPKSKSHAISAAAETSLTRHASTSNSLHVAPVSAAKPASTTRIVVPKRGAGNPATAADVAAAYPNAGVKSASNALGTATQSLQTFTLQDLAQFTKE